MTGPRRGRGAAISGAQGGALARSITADAAPAAPDGFAPASFDGDGMSGPLDAVPESCVSTGGDGGSWLRSATRRGLAIRPPSPRAAADSANCGSAAPAAVPAARSRATTDVVASSAFFLPARVSSSAAAPLTDPGVARTPAAFADAESGASDDEDPSDALWQLRGPFTGFAPHRGANVVASGDAAAAAEDGSDNPFADFAQSASAASGAAAPQEVQPAVVHRVISASSDTSEEDWTDALWQLRGTLASSAPQTVPTSAIAAAADDDTPAQAGMVAGPHADDTGLPDSASYPGSHMSPSHPGSHLDTGSHPGSHTASYPGSHTTVRSRPIPIQSSRTSRDSRNTPSQLGAPARPDVATGAFGDFPQTAECLTNAAAALAEPRGASAADCANPDRDRDLFLDRLAQQQPASSTESLHGSQSLDESLTLGGIAAHNSRQLAARGKDKQSSMFFELSEAGSGAMLQQQASSDASAASAQLDMHYDAHSRAKLQRSSGGAGGGSRGGDGMPSPSFRYAALRDLPLSGRAAAARHAQAQVRLASAVQKAYNSKCMWHVCSLAITQDCI